MNAKESQRGKQKLKKINDAPLTYQEAFRIQKRMCAYSYLEGVEDWRDVDAWMPLPEPYMNNEMNSKMNSEDMNND